MALSHNAFRKPLSKLQPGILRCLTHFCDGPRQEQEQRGCRGSYRRQYHRGEGRTLLFYAETYSRKEVWLTTSQVDKAQDLPHIVSRKDENNFLKFLQANEYQYCALLLTVPNLAFEKFGAVNVDRTSE